MKEKDVPNLANQDTNFELLMALLMLMIYSMHIKMMMMRMVMVMLMVMMMMKYFDEAGLLQRGWTKSKEILMFVRYLAHFLETHCAQCRDQLAERSFVESFHPMIYREKTVAETRIKRFKIKIHFSFS